MARMERHRGHWFNWYDTQTLQPLRPAYVSSVDSGNLAGHLLTLRAGLKRLADAPPHDDALFAGLADTLAAAAAGHAQRATTRCPWSASRHCLPTRAPPRRARRTNRARHGRRCRCVPTTCLPPCRGRRPPRTCRCDVSPAPTETQRWAQALKRQCEAAAAEVRCALIGVRGDGPRPVARDRARRAARAIAAARRARRHDGRDGLRLPLRPGARPARDRLQRRRPAPRRRALRPARFRGAARELRRHRHRPDPAGELVRTRPPARDARRARRCCCRGAARCSST